MGVVMDVLRRIGVRVGDGQEDVGCRISGRGAMGDGYVCLVGRI